MFGRIVSVVLILTILAILLGCSNDGLRRMADTLDSTADAGDVAVRAIERGLSVAGGADAWLAIPENWSLVEMLPAPYPDRIREARDTGADLAPIISGGLAELTLANEKTRAEAARLRVRADESAGDGLDAAANLISALGALLTSGTTYAVLGVGVASAVVNGIRNRRAGQQEGEAAGRFLGAREVALTFNRARALSSDFNDQFDDAKVGGLLKAEFASASPEVQSAINQAKVKIKG